MTFHTLDHQQNNLTDKLIEFVVQLQDQIARQHEQLTEQETLITKQQDQIVQLKEQNAQQQEYIEALKAEIVRLKKLSPKPDIKPNTAMPGSPSVFWLRGNPTSNKGITMGYGYLHFCR